VKDKATAIAWEVLIELSDATEKFGSFASAHEGYAVIKEELDELWEWVRSKDDPSRQRMRQEAIQIAAMGIRFVMDVCDAAGGRESRTPKENE
jgi:hypothetical protein